MVVDIFMQIDDVFCVPKDGHILHDGEDVLHHPELPTYHTYYSEHRPLTLTDCHLAIKKIICQARLIGFEIARRKLPFFKRMSRKIKLQGDPREFDITLANITEDFDYHFTVHSLEMLTSDTLLMNMLEKHVKAHNDFGASSGI